MEKRTITNRPVTPPVEQNSPSVSVSPPLERGKHTRQPPAYLKDFVCDCVKSGKYESHAGCRTERLATKCGSCEHHGKVNFREGGVVGGINTPEANISSHVQRTRCPAFSNADIAKGRRISNLSTSKPEH